MTYTLLALLASYISFSIVQMNINYAYFFFSISRSIGKISQMAKQATPATETEGETLKNQIQ